MLPIFLIFVLAFLLRIIKISDYLFFGFEQGRDLLIIQKIYQFQDFVLVGPSTSIGGVFHGPWYYYLLSFPLGLFSGNPIAASILLIILGSFVPVIIYFLAKDIFNSKFWGIIASIFTALSFEYILYSRWLSNVSPAPLFIALSLWSLWKYIKVKSQKYFLMFTAFAIIATLFQMILIVQFVFLLVMLRLLKLIKIPNLRTSFFSILIILVFLSPMIIFDFRNEHIISNSLVNFVTKKDEGNGNIFGGLLIFLIQVRHHLQLSLVNVDSVFTQISIFIFTLIGIILAYKNKYRTQTIFLLSWFLMCLPLIVISPGNPQYYVGIGLAWIMLFTLALRSFWEIKELKITTVILTLIFFIGTLSTIDSLVENKNIFFSTSQVDLNLADQRKVLDFIHNDSAGQKYKLVSFTIPSLQPEGWDYLKRYYYPDDIDENANIIYIVIEKDVYRVWEDKWISDLGNTYLIFEKKIGLLRIQKRIKE